MACTYELPSNPYRIRNKVFKVKQPHPGVAVTEFRPSYQRATVMQAGLMGTLAGLARWGAAGGIGWLIGGLVFGAVIPFTLFVIFPINKRLLDLDLTSPEVGPLLDRWGTLHAVRSAASFVAFVLFLLLRR
jgi:anthrone oxygenase-like protein